MPFAGTIRVPSDKSISHRAVLFAGLAQGVSHLEAVLPSADVQATIRAIRALGARVDLVAGPHGLVGEVEGIGLAASKSTRPLVIDCGNSGTTARLLMGALAGLDVEATLVGDASLSVRPMRRVTDQLSKLGARFESDGGHLPVRIVRAGALHGAHVVTEQASAQVKSAILLAGLYADGETSVTEPALSRNHTELMLKSFGADITSTVNPDGTATAHVKPCQELYGQSICVPGDISSAAYFIAAGLLTLDSELLVKNVGINKTRAGFLEVCRNMGADITLVNESLEGGEPRADILVRTSKLHGTMIEGALIPTLIDEIPMIAVMAACAEGTTIIKDAAELKVKETNRIDTTTEALRSMGADITPTDDGMIIQGGHALHGAKINSYLDHRIAMAFAIAALSADGDTIIHDSQCVDVSYPEFFEILDGCR